jgi:hypothetical protein
MRFTLFSTSYSLTSKSLPPWLLAPESLAEVCPAWTPGESYTDVFTASSARLSGVKSRIADANLKFAEIVTK